MGTCLGYSVSKPSIDTKAINALRFFPNSGHLLLSASADSSIKIFDVYHNRELLRTYKGHTKSGRLSPTRRFRSVFHFPRDVMWDISQKTPLAAQRLPVSGITDSGIVTAIDFNPLGTQFLSASYDRMLKMFDTETGQCTARFTTGKIPHVVVFNPSSPHEFLCGMSDKKIVQFDTRSGEMTRTYLTSFSLT